MQNFRKDGKWREFNSPVVTFEGKFFLDLFDFFVHFIHVVSFLFRYTKPSAKFSKKPANNVAEWCSYDDSNSRTRLSNSGANTGFQSHPYILTVRIGVERSLLNVISFPAKSEPSLNSMHFGCWCESGYVCSRLVFGRSTHNFLPYTLVSFSPSPFLYTS